MTRILPAAPQAWQPGTVNWTILISARTSVANEIKKSRHNQTAIIFFILNLIIFINMI